MNCTYYFTKENCVINKNYEISIIIMFILYTYIYLNYLNLTILKITLSKSIK